MTSSFFSYNKKYCCTNDSCDCQFNQPFLLLVLLLLGHQTFLCCFICHLLLKKWKKRNKKTVEPNKQRCCLFPAVWLWLKLRIKPNSHIDFVWSICTHFLMQFFESFASNCMIIQFMINLTVWSMRPYQRYMKLICKRSANLTINTIMLFHDSSFNYNCNWSGPWCKAIIVGIQWSRQPG